MDFIISYRKRKNGKTTIKRNVHVTEEKLDSILSDPNCLILNGGHA